MANLFSRPLYFKILVAILICILAVIAYSNTFHSSFHFDDRGRIITNLAIRKLSNLKVIWNYWPARSIIFLSFAFNYYSNGLDVFGYHLINFIIHLGMTLLVFWFVNITFSTPVMNKIAISRHAAAIALFASLIFLAHPIQTESVTYICQRCASLAGFTYLLSLCLYIKSRLLKEGGRKGLVLYVLSWIFGIAAMFTKENTITLPLMIVLFEFCFFEKKKWGYALAFLILLPVIPILLYFSKLADFARVAEKPITVWYYFLTQLRVMVTYLRLVFFPANQNLDYDYSVSHSLQEPSVILSLLVLLLILFIAVRIFPRRRLLSFSIFWFFITLMPESSLVPIDDVIFEHRLYLPMVGFSLFLSGSIFYLLAEKKKKVIIQVISAITACFFILTYHRNLAWKDEITLWSDVIRKSPRKARSHTERGVAYTERKNYVKALVDLNKAIELDPKFSYAYNNRGNLYAAQGKLTEAIPEFLKAIAFRPDYAGAYYNLGNVYGLKGNFNTAIQNYNLALKFNPNFAEAYNNRAFYYFLKKEYHKALRDVKKAQSLRYNVSPLFLNALNNSLRSKK